MTKAIYNIKELGGGEETAGRGGRGDKKEAVKRLDNPTCGCQLTNSSSNPV